MEHWQIAAEEAKRKKEFAAKWPLLGKRVRRFGEEGKIILDRFDDSEEEYFIEFRPGDIEQLVGAPYKIWDDEKQEWD